MGIAAKYELGLSLNYLNNTVFREIKAQEGNLKSTLATMAAGGGNVTQTDMLLMQQAVQQWGLFVDIQSTITKQIADTLKSIVQKSS